MANTLKLGAGKWATGTDTVLAFNDENNNFKPLPFDFSRASSATVVNQSGLIETVGSGTPRIDFLGNTKGALLLEPTRTNSLVQSNQFDTTWTTTNATVTSGQIGVGGSSDAWLLSKSSVGGRINQSISLNGVQTTSIYAKANTSNWIAFISGGSKTAYFDLQNGVLGTISGTAIDAKIESVGNGWYRCSLIQDVTLTQIRVYIAEDDLDVSGTSGSIYIQYAQVEAGSYATSYIPTSGSAVTRVAETCSQTVPDGVIGQTEGVLFMDVNLFARGQFSYFAIAPNLVSSSNYIGIGINQSSFSFEVVISGTAVVAYNFSNSSTGNFKIAFAYKQNDFVAYVNGVQVMTDTSGAVLSCSQIGLNNFNQNQPFLYKQAKLYNTRLSNAELASLTTI